MSRCEECKIEKATAWFRGMEVCRRCYNKLKEKGRIKRRLEGEKDD